MKKLDPVMDLNSDKPEPKKLTELYPTVPEFSITAEPHHFNVGSAPG
jgi:hypothetical protein